MEETIKTGIPPSAEMEDVNVSRLDDSEADNTGATAGADESPCTDTEGGGTERGAEADCKEDPEDSSHPGADAEGSGEVSRDEPGTAPEADAEKEKTAVEDAVRKLNEWKAENKRNTHADLICNHMIKRCRQDAGFAADVLKEDKSWDGCFEYIKVNARKKAVHGCAMIEDHVVYEWAEDYIRKEPDKKSQKSDKKSQKTGKKSTKSQETCTKPAENAQNATENAQNATENATSAPEVDQQEPKKKPAKPKKQKPKPEEKKTEKPKKEKKDKAEMDGQIDLFSLFG